MAKLTEKKFNEYKAINIEGFKVDLHKILYPFAHGDEYPQLRQMVYDDEDKQLVLTISYFKFYGGKGEYKIEVNEYRKSKESRYMMGGTGKFNKDYYLESTGEKTKFNFKYLQTLCNKFDITELKERSLNDYNEYLNKRIAI